MCSGISASCNHDNYLQVKAIRIIRLISVIMASSQLQVDYDNGQNYTNVCPSLDHSSSSDKFLLPVQAKRNLDLVTRNLPPIVSLLNCTIICIARSHKIEMEVTAEHDSHILPYLRYPQRLVLSHYYIR